MKRSKLPVMDARCAAVRMAASASDNSKHTGARLLERATAQLLEGSRTHALPRCSSGGFAHALKRRQSLAQAIMNSSA